MLLCICGGFVECLMVLGFAFASGIACLMDRNLVRKRKCRHSK